MCPSWRLEYVYMYMYIVYIYMYTVLLVFCVCVCVCVYISLITVLMWSKFMSCTLFNTWHVVVIKFLHKMPFYVLHLEQLKHNIVYKTDKSNMYFMSYKKCEFRFIHLYLKIFYIRSCGIIAPWKWALNMNCIYKLHM